MRKIRRVPKNLRKGLAMQVGVEPEDIEFVPRPDYKEFEYKVKGVLQDAVVVIPDPYLGVFSFCGREGTPAQAITIKWMCKESYRVAVEHGWWYDPDKPRTRRIVDGNFGEKVALMHSELSEALEAWRDPNQEPYWVDARGKPQGIVSELADVLIRIADICGRNGWDLEKAVREKMAYNDTRSYRHGGKRA